jgi:ribosome-binding factor A
MGDYEGRRRKSRRGEGEVTDGARSLRLQELIRQEVDFLLRNEIRDRRLDGVFITLVELTGDGGCARIWFSAPEEHEVLEALAGATGFLRSRLAESLGLKRTPDLRFKRDRATRTFDFEAKGD